MGRKRKKKKKTNGLKPTGLILDEASEVKTEALAALTPTSIPLSECKKKKLYPRKLYPPPEVMRRMIEEEKSIVPKNPIVRFFKLFFGEGL